MTVVEVLDTADERLEWIENGWARGCFIELSGLNLAEISSYLPESILSKIQASELSFLIPLTYDCALVHDDFTDEPWAQYLVCWKCQPDANMKNARNPRVYHYPVMLNGEEVYFGATALGFGFISREQLLRCTPCPDAEWPENGLKKCLRWAAGRILQDVFPDDWNNRISSKQKLLKKLWDNKDLNEYVSGVFVELSSDDELPPEKMYSAKIIILITDELKGRAFGAFEKTKGNDYITRLKSIFDIIEGVELKEAVILSENGFTRALEKKYKRMPLDYFSYKTTPHGAM